jgi:tetratricopeptide (TPR) repeat protein
MEPDQSLSDSPNQTALQQAELAALLRMLSISEGTFSLSIAICNSPALREYLMGKIRENKADIEKIPIEKNCTDVLASAQEEITTKRPSAVFISEIENAVSSGDVQPRIIRNLNASRELWRQKFSCPVVFWLPEYAATMLQKDALDFASWISHRFEFVSEQTAAMAGTLDAFAGDVTAAGRLDADQKRFRIAELEQRIDEAGDPPKAQLVQHVLTWLNELVYLYYTIGGLERAEQNILKSLEIEEKLGQQEGMARDYGNLGLIYQTRGDLKQAEQMLRKSLEIDEKLGRQEGMANQYGNLGLIYKARGDLEQAEQMLRKSLEIDEKLGRLEGMASSYANLGLICHTRGDLDQAREYLEKAVELFKKVGMKPETEKVQGWIDGLDRQGESKK